MPPFETPPTPPRSAAYNDYVSMISRYQTFLNLNTFPWIPFAIAAAFQVFAWFGGKFLGSLGLFSRIFVLWFFALGEYSIMSPAMNASVEVLNISESMLIVMYQVITLVVFIVINVTVFRNPFHLKYAASFILLALAVYIAHL
jgi:uncharacterized protein (DUF486 family)